MPVKVFVGYQSEDGVYHGFVGSLKAVEFRLLRGLAERCRASEILSTDQLKALSDAKDFLAKAQINLYELEKQISKTEKKKLEKTNRAIGEALESFDVYRKDAPQLDFLLSFCIIDLYSPEIDEETDERSENFQSADTVDEEEGLFLSESIESGVFKYIVVPEDFVSVISEWNELDGRRQVEQTNSEGEIEWIEGDFKFPDTAVASEIEWWKDNINYFEKEPDFDLTTMLFRALRNNALKCKRTIEVVLSHKNWKRRIEIL